uniref:Uncharacterized protein n=1 Tax=Salix viminalis TaxID=40686 RepID=A0A6N2KMM3_SALVM
MATTFRRRELFGLSVAAGAAVEDERKLSRLFWFIEEKANFDITRQVGKLNLSYVLFESQHYAFDSLNVAL